MMNSKEWWKLVKVNNRKSEGDLIKEKEAQAKVEAEKQRQEEIEAGFICPQCRAETINIEVLKCKACDWQGEKVDDIPVLLSERGKKDPLLNRYTQIYDQIAADDIEDSMMSSDYVRVLAEHTAKMVGSNLAGQRGCDIGSGKGLLLDELIKRDADVTAVDIAMPYLKRLKDKNKDLKCILANAEELPFKERFDFVTCTDVMEHVLNLSNFLYSINQAVKPGGRAIIRVPYRENILGYATHLGCSYDLVHLRTYNEELLKDDMKNAGFAIDEISFGGFSLSMHLPRSCDNDQERAMDVIGIRKTLQDRGITYDDLDEMPEWFARQISRAYVITVIGRKTHRIEKNKQSIFDLVPC